VDKPVDKLWITLRPEGAGILEYGNIVMCL